MAGSPRKRASRRYTPSVPRHLAHLLLLAAIWSASVLAQEEPVVHRSIVPVVGQTRGVADVEWYSELVMTNHHSAELTVGLTLMGGGEPFFFTTMAPGQTIELGELVASVFGAPGTVSVLEIASMGPGPVSVGVRVFGNRDGEIVSAQPIPIYGPSLPYVVQRLDELVVSDRFRTNLGVANSNEEDATVSLSLQRVDGRAFATATLQIEGRSLYHMPLQSFFPLLTEGGGLTVVAESSRSGVIVFASVISNSTQSAKFVAPSP